MELLNKYSQITSHFPLTFECKFGEEECHGNKLHNCAKKYSATNDHFLIFASCFVDLEAKPDYLSFVSIFIS